MTAYSNFFPKWSVLDPEDQSIPLDRNKFDLFAAKFTGELTELGIT